MGNIFQVLPASFIEEEPYEVANQAYEAGRLNLDMDMVNVDKLGTCLVVFKMGTMTPTVAEIWAWIEAQDDPADLLMI